MSAIVNEREGDAVQEGIDKESNSEQLKSKNYADIKIQENEGGGNCSEKKILRKYHVTDEQKAKLEAEALATGRECVNPYRNGLYWASIESLILLGTNKYHDIRVVRDKMCEIMSKISKTKRVGGVKIDTNAWDDFYNKSSRSNAVKPKDGLGRIEQNFRVLQRLPRVNKKEKNPYGLKLAQFGLCIDIKYILDEETNFPISTYRLNTEWDEDPLGQTIDPVYDNPFVKRGRKKKVDKTEEVAVKETSSTGLTESASFSGSSEVSSEVSDKDISDDGLVDVPDVIYNDFEE